VLKVFRIMLSCLLIFSLISFTINKQQIIAATDYGNQFLNEVKLYDSNGNEIQSGQSVSPYENMQVVYDWSIPNDIKLQKGDTMTFSLPKELTISSNISFDVLDENGNVIGTAKANPTTGEVVVTFTDYVENHENLKGNISIWTQWNKEEIKGEENIGLEFPINGDTINIEVEVPSPTPVDPDTKLIKYGWVDADDPTLIYWIVKLNLNGENISNAKYEDVLGPNQNLIESSIHVSLGDYDLSDPNLPYTEKELVSKDKISINDNGFTVDFGELNSGAYVTYATKATDDGKSEQYTNKGILTGSNIEEVITSVNTPNSGGNGSGGGTKPPEPSTEEPSTEEPSTEEPSTEEPSTEEPSTEEPSTEEPSTEEPSTEEPSTEEPSTEEPSTEEPSTEEPSTEDEFKEKPSSNESSKETNKLPDTGEKIIDSWIPWLVIILLFTLGTFLIINRKKNK
jgi:LPXTG-motif cell wall-anchored protein